MSTVPTYQVAIYMAGDPDTAKRYLRRYCYEIGLCVTVTPTDFIYTGGEETGFVVGLLSYPRFNQLRATIREHATQIARALIVECCQRTALVVDREETTRIEISAPGGER